MDLLITPKTCFVLLWHLSPNITLLPKAATDLLSATTNYFAFSRSIYNWNCTTCIFFPFWIFFLKHSYFALHLHCHRCPHAFIIIAEQQSVLWMSTICLSIHLLINTWVASSWGQLQEKTAMNIHLFVFVWKYAYISFAYL